MESQVKEIEMEISKLEKQSSEVLEVPELKQYRYDLRAVLVHDGQFGRSHIYSYTYDKEKWWLTNDQEVHEVHEDLVLNDTAGLHYGAGPYMLLYSRALPEDMENAAVQWPERLKSPVIHNNTRLLKDTGDDQDTPSPAYATPSSIVANASPHELMDTTE